MINETLSCLTVAAVLTPPSPPLSNPLPEGEFANVLCNLLNALLLRRFVCICVLSGLKVVRELSVLHICHICSVLLISRELRDSQIHLYLYLEFIVRNRHVVVVCRKQTTKWETTHDIYELPKMLTFVDKNSCSCNYFSN